MGSLIYSAAGTTNLVGATLKKLDVSKLDPRLLMTSTDPAPTPAEARANAKQPLAAGLRAQLLETMGLSEEDILNMRAETRADLEDQIARHVHQQVRSLPAPPTGAYVDVQA